MQVAVYKKYCYKFNILYMCDCHIITSYKSNSMRLNYSRNSVAGQMQEPIPREFWLEVNLSAAVRVYITPREVHT